MQIFKRYFKIIIPSLFLLYSKFSFAQEGLVPCGPGTAHPMCDNICYLLEMISKIAFFIVRNVMPPLAGLLFLIGGIMMVAAAGSEERYKKGRQIVLNTAIGVVIVLVSWLLVNSIITIVGQNNGYVGTWWQPGGCP